MKLYDRLSIRGKFSILFGTLIIAGALVINIIVPWIIGRDALRSLHDKARSVGQMLGSCSIAGMEFDDAQSVSDILSNARFDEDLRFVGVYSTKGELFSSFNPYSLNTGTVFQMAEPEKPRVRHGTLYTKLVLKKGEATQGYLVSCISVERMQKTVWAARLLAFGIGIGMILVGILTIFYLTEQVISAPVGHLRSMMREVANGDLTKRMRVYTEDEIGELGTTFNSFVEHVHSVMSKVIQSSIQVAQAAEELSASSAEMAAGAEEQTTKTSRVAISVEQISATVQEVAKNASEAAMSAKNSGETAHKGGEIVQQTIAGINRIQSSVNELQKVISGLSKNSDKISDIIRVIEELADQTNLLALNAAIEAARAGEQGRGFAVVADEVRKLAERTTASTKEISLNVKNIQSDTALAVSSMHTGSNEVSTGVSHAQLAETSLKDIVASVRAVQDMIQQIATSAEELSAATEEIAANIVGIADVAKKSANGSKETSHAAQMLSSLTNDLRGLMVSFKLSETDKRAQ